MNFEPDLKARWLLVSFDSPAQLGSKQDVQSWRSAWSEQLRQWHTPYKALWDLTHLEVVLTPETEPEVLKALSQMVAFLKGFFLRDICGVASTDTREHWAQLFPFSLFASREEALAHLKIRDAKKLSSIGGAQDFRGQLVFENHFRERFIELTFRESVVLDSQEKIAILKDKLTNMLMLWHSPWALIVDCSRLEIPQAQHDAVERMFGFFRRFFMKSVTGFMPQSRDIAYPFPVARTRHMALLGLTAQEHESAVGEQGDAAHCRSRGHELQGKIKSE